MIIIYKDLLLNETTKKELKDNYYHKDNKIHYVDDNSVITIEYNTNKIYLLKKGSIISDIELDINNNTICNVYSQFGNMQMNCECEFININENNISFQYKLLQDNQLVSHINISVVF